MNLKMFVLNTVAMIVFCVIMGYILLINYALFDEQCENKEIPNKFMFFVYLIPYMFLSCSAIEWIFSKAIFAPKQLFLTIKNRYYTAFNKED